MGIEPVTSDMAEERGNKYGVSAHTTNDNFTNLELYMEFAVIAIDIKTDYATFITLLLYDDRYHQEIVLHMGRTQCQKNLDFGNVNSKLDFIIINIVKNSHFEILSKSMLDNRFREI